jgi:hypothetical protein
MQNCFIVYVAASLHLLKNTGGEFPAITKKKFAVALKVLPCFNIQLNIIFGFSHND